MDKLNILGAKEMFKAAKDLDEKGQTADAMELYGKAIEIDPDLTAARIRLAYIYYRLGGHKSMQKQLDEAFERDTAAILEYDNVFRGRKSFYERNLYKERSINNIEEWKEQLPPRWYPEQQTIGEYQVIFFRNEEHYYVPNDRNDAEVLIYPKSKEYPEYLLVRRWKRDD